MRLEGLGRTKPGSMSSNAAQRLDGLTMGHGQFTALAVAPFPIDVQKWINGLFDRSGADLNKEELLRGYATAAGEYNGIVMSLASAEDEFELPELLDEIEYARSWSRGFVNVMMEAPEEWERLLKGTLARNSTNPMRILDLGPEDEAAKQEMAKTLSISVDEFELALVGSLRTAILKLYKVAKALRGPTQPIATAPSRNDPCICNSGKKYKKCCGA